MEKQQINAHPTKAFFVDMLTRDIQLEQAILDLVDNSIDGAKGLMIPGERPYDGRKIEIFFDRQKFKITDNCGGFSVNVATNYAFRFGRPSSAKPTAHSIGQFGVGMKRALFKFGRHFEVKSATHAEQWAVDVDVTAWEAEESTWSFPWADFKTESDLSSTNPGTEIVVSNLRPEVSLKFSLKNFENGISSLIKSKHRQFISMGLMISVNGIKLDATNIHLLVSDKLTPGTDLLEFGDEDKKVVAKIIVGIGTSSPKDAGWYVICNGRVILEADRRKETGWGLIEEGSNNVVIPSFHNQFSRFRGIVNFDSESSGQVPWNTTKTDVDQDSPIWQKTFSRMLEMMRPVMDFLNELDSDIDEYTREQSPLLDHVVNATPKQPESFQAAAEFVAPARGTIVKGPKMIKIQYSRTVEDTEFLQDELGVSSAKAVGEKTFDMILRKRRNV